MGAGWPHLKPHEYPRYFRGGLLRRLPENDGFGKADVRAFYKTTSIAHLLADSARREGALGRRAPLLRGRLPRAAGAPVPACLDELVLVAS